MRGARRVSPSHARCAHCAPYVPEHRLTWCWLAGQHVAMDPWARICTRWLAPPKHALEQRLVETAHEQHIARRTWPPHIVGQQQVVLLGGWHTAIANDIDSTSNDIVCRWRGEASAAVSGSARSRLRVDADVNAGAVARCTAMSWRAGPREDTRRIRIDRGVLHGDRAIQHLVGAFRQQCHLDSASISCAGT